MSSVLADTHEDSSDDDSYYDRLQSECDCDGDHKNEVDIETSSFLSETEYFDMVNNHGSLACSTFLSEDSDVWSKFEYVTPGSLKLVEDIDMLRELLTWLFSRLPLSSKTYGAVKTVLRNMGMVGTTVYTDSVQNPSLVVVFEETTGSIAGDTCEASLFISPLTTIGISAFCKLVDALSYNTLIFGGLGVEIGPLIERYSETLDASWCSCPYGMFVLQSKLSELLPNPPNGYCLDKLKVVDAKVVDDAWLYKSEGSLNMIENMILNLPCYGIYDANGLLVSWCLTYGYGALGMLHTVIEHRKKGLAECVVTAILYNWNRSQFNCAPFAYIADDNESSKSLFSKLGFIRADDCTWEGFSKAKDIHVCSSVDNKDLEGILKLHKANHVDNISPSEALREGFVTAKYDLTMLSTMHSLTPHIIAKVKYIVVGYALVIDRCCSLISEHTLLRNLMTAVDQIAYKGISLKYSKYILVGQLCVAKAYRGQGIVTRLYNHFRESYSCSYDYCITDISIQNPRSLRAHIKAGFQIIDTFNYAGDGWHIVLCDWTFSLPNDADDCIPAIG